MGMRIPGVQTAYRWVAGEAEGLLSIVDFPEVDNPAGTNMRARDGHTIKLGSEEWLFGPGKNTFTMTQVFPHAGIIADIRKLKNFEGNHYWADAPLSFHTMLTGHYYLAINLVGSFPRYSVKQALELMGANVNNIFPFGGASGGTGAPLKVGDTLHLTDLRRLANVDVVYTCPVFFTLRTQLIHPLRGIVLHGVFHDNATNTLWMLQEGFGYPMDRKTDLEYFVSPGYGVADQLRGTLANYQPARLMWATFAHNMAELLEKNPEPLS